MSNGGTKRTTGGRMHDLSKATPELFAALAKAQGEIENASKNAANPHFRSRYADLAEVLNTVRPVFAANGLSLTQTTEFDGVLVSVTTVIAHSGGGYITSTASCVPAKTDAQGIGSATTYLRRYGAAAMAGIAQEDDDGNAAAHNGKPAKRAEPDPAIKAKIEACDSLDALRELWKSLTPEQRRAHADDKEAAKSRIEAEAAPA